MSTPSELRARAAELEQRVPPATAGPRTDDERMWLEKAAALRAEADQFEEQEEDDEPGPVLCECGTTTDLLHDCDAVDRPTEK
ncbi:MULTISPECIES: hypothetical protein [Streptomyces]|uniref:hypothetical protein n=1 Tax=Streptomyces TaxID=1883 RepID=UPI000AB4F4B6|nr:MULTISPECIES: hypothetical protein [Streptomyces]